MKNKQEECNVFSSGLKQQMSVSHQWNKNICVESSFPPGQFVPEHHTLPGHKSHLMAPDHLGGIEFDIQLLWSAQTFDSPYQLWRATSSYSRSVAASRPIMLTFTSYSLIKLKL